MKENSKKHFCIQRMSGWCELITMVFESIPELLIGNNSKIRRITYVTGLRELRILLYVIN